MSGPAPQSPPAAPPPGPARSKRRRLVIGASAAAGLAAVMLGADAALGAVAEERARCQAVGGGVTLEIDIAALPVTSGLTTGSIGTAAAHVPWHVLEEQAAMTRQPGAAVSLTGDAGLVIAEISGQALPVTARLQPEITRSGEIELTLIDLEVAGRDVPLALAQAFSGTDSLLPGLSAGDGPDVPYEVTSVDVRDDGLDLDLRIPFSALTRSGDGSQCAAAPIEYGAATAIARSEVWSAASLPTRGSQPPAGRLEAGR